MKESQQSAVSDQQSEAPTWQEWKDQICIEFRCDWEHFSNQATATFEKMYEQRFNKKPVTKTEIR